MKKLFFVLLLTVCTSSFLICGNAQEHQDRLETILEEYSCLSDGARLCCCLAFLSAPLMPVQATMSFSILGSCALCCAQDSLQAIERVSEKNLREYLLYPPKKTLENEQIVQQVLQRRQSHIKMQ
ncbi:hypothetical protein KAZ82_01275 [Candidatus Babeliales bacterium]|nr:hypothetical protein [Candidatus Babeliales bacterium]